MSTVQINNPGCGRTFVLWLMVVAGFNSATVMSANEVVTWGATSSPVGLSNVVGIAVGLALTAEGRVVGWWDNHFGQTNIPSGLSNVVAIAAGTGHRLALTAEGRVVGWGNNDNGQRSIPNDLSNVVAIAAGYAHSLAVKSDGRVVGWGWNANGQTSIPNGLSNVIAIAGGVTHSLALTANGRVRAWGDNADGQTNIPSGLSNVVAIAAGGHHSLALTADGRITGWGWEYGGATVPSGLSNVICIAGGLEHSLAVTVEGFVVAWGANDEHQSSVPSGLSNVVSVAGGDMDSVALTADGAPGIINQPVSQSVILGAPAMLQARGVLAAGTPSLRYQWRKDGAQLAGQTNPVLRLTSVTPSDAGGYSVVVSNFAGRTTTSSVANLTLRCLLNVISTTGGAVIRNPDLSSYASGSLVGLTATPLAGYGFIRWSGHATGSSNPLTVTMSTNKNITVVFVPVIVTVASNGIGTVAKLPDRTLYSVGDQVTLNATAGRWHRFSGWTDGNTNNPRVVTIDESNAGSYTATFVPTVPLETVSIGNVTRLAPVGMPAVLADGAFIVAESVSTRGSASITLSTTISNGTLLYTLDGSEPSAGTIYTVPFRVGRTCLLRTIAYNANFSQSVLGDPLSVVILPIITATTDGGGTVAIQPASGDYFSNSMAWVTATPKAGWEFLQWLGDASGANPVLNLSMSRDRRVRAVFGTSLGTTAVGGGSIRVDPTAAAYPFGSSVRLTAVPANGNYLAFWSNAAGGKTNNPLTFTVTNANPTVVAVFNSLGGPSQTNALTVIPNGPGQVTLTPPGNRFPRNTNVVLHALPDAGQNFLGWSGAVGNTNNPLVVTMTSNTVLTANFTKRPQLQGEGHRELLSQEGFRLTVTGDWDVAYRIDHSTNLTEWTPLTTLTNTFGTVQFTDGAGSNLPSRFYRAVTPP